MLALHQDGQYSKKEVMIHQIQYPKARYIVVEVNLSTGAHQLLNRESISNSEAIGICQCRGPVEPNKTRHLLLAHKDSGEKPT